MHCCHGWHADEQATWAGQGMRAPSRLAATTPAVAERLCLPCLVLIARQAVHGDAQDGSLGGGRGVDEVESQGAQACHQAALHGGAGCKGGQWGIGCARAVGASGCKGGQS